MTLQDKLKDIAKPKLRAWADGNAWSDGNAATIAEFWDGFVEDRLPEKNVATEWYQLLKDYVQSDDAVYAIRFFADKQGDDPKSLRRGFLTKVNNKTSYFFTDNFHADYYAKMAIDGFVPTINEFKKSMTAREFPARYAFGGSYPEEVARAAYNIQGKNPGFHLPQNLYKIAHVINAGTDYLLPNGHIKGIGDICQQYCPRGNYDDWKKKNSYYLRELSLNPTNIDLLKRFLMSHYLRFVCPMNYFFIPTPKRQSSSIPIPKNDIGEHPDLQRYAIYRFYKRYGDDYIDYLKRIMLPPSILNSINKTEIQKLSAFGSTLIDLSYNHNHQNQKKSGVKPKSNRILPKTITPQPFKNYLETSTNRNGKPFSSNVINSYCSSLNHPLFKTILTRHGLSSDIYKCTNIIALKTVYDEVSQKSTSDARKLAEKRHGACKSALREYVCYLRTTKQATQDNGQVFD